MIQRTSQSRSAWIIKGIRQSIILVTLASFLGLLTYWIHPKAPDWQTSRLDEGVVTLGTLQSEAENVLWIDARKESDYLNEHIPEALHLSEDNWDDGFNELMMRWDGSQTIIVYCDGGGCQASKAVVNRLKSDLGFEAIYYLKEGYDEWKNHYN